MNDLEIYISPQAEIVYYTTCSTLCAGYNDSWARSVGNDSTDPGGIVLPDDNWDEGN